ncbi:sulfite reductase flavoprotein subunit alpha [Mycobacterium sp. PS03-16]|uniref:diflavin oxidoreductase n=1 Tax=Mycobacterium sp. PS03-16 TaxID=2559611 RepID=UPI001074734D|nr:sulfite reductase flavoprotein subunit alpha [Mycobacterium sp. PS03-16]TFV55163.1 sulfite reductase flavoprotein subunit alpha [Mycobacterium sp. PS03-16]
MTGRPEFSLIVAFGTDMGNAEDAAMTFAESCRPAGIDVEAVELNQVEIADLRSATHFVAVTSTFGDGEFPDNATLFWEALRADVEPLDHLHFAVLALGDLGYDLFCNAGKLLDARLEALGATRIADRVDIDGPYEQQAKAWTTDVVKVLAAAHSTAETGEIVTESPGGETPARDRHQPVAARLAVNRLLSGAGSDKEVRHYEIDVTEPGFTYRAGDSIAVHATNDPVLVTEILAELGVGPDQAVADHEAPLGVVLTEQVEIRTPSRALRALVAARHPAAADAPESFWYGRDVLDLIRLGGLGVDELLDTLRPLQCRDYSIASSPLVHPDRVHLTVATVRYTAGDRRHGGVASTYLAERGDRLRVHLRPNHAFRLPAADVPIIMIGPGTGIAPFRGFLQERRAVGATGRSWLFFGDRRRGTDFLYGDELAEFLDAGTLTRLDLAFSRDGDIKEYVQQRMWANAAELYAWLDDGAHLYVCGDAERMARDVDAALHGIVAHCGGLDADAAHGYVNDLIRTHRYVRDVY